jgi:hypothetical protein
MELVAHDMHDPNNMRQVLEAVTGEVKAENSQVRSCKVLIPSYTVWQTRASIRASLLFEWTKLYPSLSLWGLD